MSKFKMIGNNVYLGNVCLIKIIPSELGFGLRHEYSPELREFLNAESDAINQREEKRKAAIAQAICAFIEADLPDDIRPAVKNVCEHLQDKYSISVEPNNENR